MAADNLLTDSTTEAGTTAHERQEQKGSLARIVTGVRMATFALALGVGSAQAQQPTEPVQGPILIAQANIEDGRTGPYTAFIPQISDGKMKEIKFYRDKNGLIIPLPIENGKLVDGSDAPSDPLRAKIAQRKIIAKYDPIILVKTERESLLKVADKDLKELVALTTTGNTPTKEQLLNGFFSVYIIKFGLNHGGVNDLFSGLETIAKVKMRMSISDIEQVKKEAEKKAINIWKSVSEDKA